jgi:hypothetical protein
VIDYFNLKGPDGHVVQVCVQRQTDTCLLLREANKEVFAFC